MANKLTLANACSCPFCRNYRIGAFSMENISQNLYQVRCMGCGAKGPVGESFDEAITKWNDRKPSVTYSQEG